ncbi:DNA-binding response regulator [Youhaiella tibetensis]|uniref:Response regulator transcription factor n=1 Tax=Paradevosia tibetensis TaxID=1447062 RepID=A0A5B9DRC6_9HYPH|nr:response regulator transcription factor [Youhaiella tibetensis]AKR56970.1 Two-component system response regulator QseB [Devosia sp. H5989]QEE21980.1 response regulator transcription factor [Youhaiella tibetensis]GGF46440.1 DNA-binding response regulator [Youhaiella tibetensis]
MRVLLIEDDRDLGGAVRDHIAAEGYAVDWVRFLEEAIDATLGTVYDLVLLDLNLPDGKGLDFLRRLRKRGDTTPVIILTAMDQVSSRIEGLNAGADDYIVKPFDLSELSARLAAVARRYSGNPNPLLAFGEIEIDQAHKLVTVGGKPVDITAREWAILERLVRHPGIVVSKSQMEETLYEFGAEIESNTVEVYVSRLRKKLGRDFIHTARGVGYRIER